MINSALDLDLKSHKILCLSIEAFFVYSFLQIMHLYFAVAVAVAVAADY
jgi:hypothetical protein